MIHNLEKNVKGCFKRRVSVTLAVLTVFAITGSVGFAADLTEEYKAADFMKHQYVYSTRGNFTIGEFDDAAAAGLIMDEVGKTNKQVNENTKEIERLEDEKASYKFVDSAISAGKAALDKEKEERKAADKALEKSLIDTYNGLNNRLLDEVGTRAKEDAKLATKIKKEENERKAADEALQAALDAEIERSKAADEKHDEGIAANKDAIQTEIAERVKADLANENAIKKEAEIRHQVDQVLGERITDNKKAIETEAERSKAEDEKHDEGIAANKDAIQTEIAERTKAVLAEENARKKADEALQAALDAEIERSEAKDKEHDEGIAANKDAIQTEIAERTKAVLAEENARKKADEALQAALDAE
ncbi:coiled-coil domain-containing protein, partial [Fusobacterium necrophorum]|uniref:hypothetical protein n=1 Tax=Fusobacterium necrophorum TaxID=859 RepID=UPI0021C4638E